MNQAFPQLHELGSIAVSHSREIDQHMAYSNGTETSQVQTEFQYLENKHASTEYNNTIFTFTHLQLRCHNHTKSRKKLKLVIQLPRNKIFASI